MQEAHSAKEGFGDSKAARASIRHHDVLRGVNRIIHARIPNGETTAYGLRKSLFPGWPDSGLRWPSMMSAHALIESSHENHPHPGVNVLSTLLEHEAPQSFTQHARPPPLTESLLDRMVRAQRNMIARTLSLRMIWLISTLPDSCVQACRAS
nr:hypothetical protein [Paraburkholderia unamae]